MLAADGLPRRAQLLISLSFYCAAIGCAEIAAEKSVEEPERCHEEVNGVQAAALLQIWRGHSVDVASKIQDLSEDEKVREAGIILGDLPDPVEDYDDFTVKSFVNAFGNTKDIANAKKKAANAKKKAIQKEKNQVKEMEDKVDAVGEGKDSEEEPEGKGKDSEKKREGKGKG